MFAINFFPFNQQFMIYALIATIVIGLSAPLVGTFIVQRQLSLVGDGLGHVGAAGVGLALWFNFAPQIIALIATVIAACTIEWIFHSSKSSDTALALIFYSGIAASIIFASYGSNQNQLQQYLFGSLLSITTNELILITAICAVVNVVLVTLHRLLLAIAIDESSAVISKVPVHLLHVILMSCVAVIVSLSISVSGLLLISAVMVVPVMSASIFSNTFFSTWISSIMLGLIGSVTGLIVAWMINGAPGGTIVLTHIFIYLLINITYKFQKKFS